VDAPGERPIHTCDVGGVIVREEVAIEHHDPPTPHVRLCDELAVPLLGEAVAEPQPGARRAARAARQGRWSGVTWRKAALDGVRDARARQPAVARLGADAHVEVAHGQARRALERPGDRRLAGAVAADEGDGEAAAARARLRGHGRRPPVCR
jgi:hypothetical protein